MNNIEQEEKIVQENQYSLNEIYYLVKKNYKIILCVFLFIFFASVYYTLIKKPVYSSKAVIMVSEDRGSMSMLDIGLGKDRNYIENEIVVCPLSIDYYFTCIVSTSISLQFKYNFTSIVSTDYYFTC